MSKESNSATIETMVRLVSSFVKEDKGKADAVIVTKFVGEAIAGLFKNFSNQLESTVFKTRCWSSIKTGEIEGIWNMTLSDARTDTVFATIKRCAIKDIVVKIGKEDILEAAITVQHGQTAEQPALESAISTAVMLHLEKDLEILEGVADADEEKESDK